MGGGVGQGPRKEEEHGGGVLRFGGAKGRDSTFEIVLQMIMHCFSACNLKSKRNKLTTQTAGTAYLPLAAASKISTALLFLSFGITGRMVRAVQMSNVGQHLCQNIPRLITTFGMTQITRDQSPMT